MSLAWKSGELLLTLWQERRWRENSYAPLSTPYSPTEADAARIEADLTLDSLWANGFRRTFPRITVTEALAPLHTEESLTRMDLISQDSY